MEPRLHVQVTKGNNVCAMQIMKQFIADPPATLDTSCAAEDIGLPFMLPAGSSID